MKTPFLLGLVMFAGLILAPVLALAQVTLPTPDDIGAFLDVFVASSVNVKIALGISALIWVLRKYVVKEVKFFSTDEGGAILLSLTSFLVALSGAFYTLTGSLTVAWFGQVCLTAFAVAVVTGGTWNLVQAYVRVLAPKLITGPLSKIPFIGTIIGKLAEYALKAVKSKLDKMAEGKVSPQPTPGQ